MSITVEDLITRLEEFQQKLTEHQKLWGVSLGQPIPDYPVRNGEELQAQSRWLSRSLGALKPYIERFDGAWIMQHPATGVQWNALDAAVGLSAIAQAKGPSIRTTIEKLDRILGQLQTLAPSDSIPEEIGKPLRPGIGCDRLIDAYLDHLHPVITRACAQLYRDGHYAKSVEEAAKAVTQHVRDVTGLQGDGAALVQAAFSPKKPVLAFSDLGDETKRNEQIGFMEMLCAFLKGVRHPLAHTSGRNEEAQNAFEYLAMASVFCRRIDEAKPKVAS